MAVQSPSTASSSRPRDARPSRRGLQESPERFLNRELSWLDFNDRVLALAADARAPLLERAKFLAIVANNLDEFFQVRVAGLKRQVAAGLGSTRAADGLTSAEQLSRIAERAGTMVRQQQRILEEEVRPGLATAGIRIAAWSELDGAARAALEREFSEGIFPVLTPLAVDPGHPFPYISNLSLNLAVIVEDAATHRRHFARVKVPPLLGRFVPAGEGVFVPLEDVIAANLAQLFPGMRIVEHHPFRVTRDADLEVDDDGADDLLEALEDELRRRRVTPAVRLEVHASMPDHVRELLMRELALGPSDCYPVDSLLDLVGLWELHAIDRPDLKDPPHQPVTPPELVPSEDGQTDVFAAVSRGDILVHHPYESFSGSVQRFIEQAAEDPNVLAIKQTLYRTSGDSPIVDALVRAAGAGKQVVVLVEIKARFDERNNIGWARLLEQAGCHVVYGVLGLKTHAKLCLVVRQEAGRIRRYVHVGTGNYNPTTARVYEDLGLLTASPRLGADISRLFNLLTGYARDSAYESLIVAPREMREAILERIEREVAHGTPEAPGRIVLKVNNLLDEAIIDALYDASRAGVEVDLLVRGMCALRPGLPQLSERIRVRSIVGRFLEHSRIFWFGNGGSPEVLIGSADLMHRNLDRRVETLVRVESEAARGYLSRVLALFLADNTSAWALDADGGWARVAGPAAGEPAVELQVALQDRAALAEVAPLSDRPPVAPGPVEADGDGEADA